MSNMTGAAIGIGAVGTIVGLYGYMLVHGMPKEYQQMERKLKRVTNDLSDLIETVGHTVKNM